MLMVFIWSRRFRLKNKKTIGELKIIGISANEIDISNALKMDDYLGIDQYLKQQQKRTKSHRYRKDQN